MNSTSSPSSSRRPSVTASLPSEGLRSLDLEHLRDYRQQLMSEEDRVSYWRRLTHARIDVLEAESRAPQPLTFEELVRALGDTGSGRNRRAFVRIKPADPLPDLPVLTEMWEREIDAHDPVQVASSLMRLRAAEQQLSAYRRALHERIDEATSELILRYRADPSAALTVLPRD